MGKKIFYLLLSFMTFILIMLIGHYFLKPTDYDQVQVLDEGWLIYYNDDIYENVRLSELRKIIGNGANKGDIIMMVHPNVDVSSYTNPSMVFESKFSAWMAFSGTKLVGKEFLEDYRNREFIGSKNNFVMIPRTYNSTTIRISLIVAEDGAYSYYEAPIVGDYDNIVKYVLYNNLFVIMISAFLIIFGLMFFAISLAFRSDMSEINMQIYSSLVFVALGIWFLTQFKQLGLFIDVGNHETEIEYISLYMVVPLMYLVMGCMRNYLKNNVFKFFLGIGAVIPLVLILMHYSGIMHINQTLFVYQIDAMLLIVFMFVMIIVIDARYHRISQSQYIQLIGQISVAVSFIFNIFFYYMEVMGFSKQIMLSKIAVPIGTMCMVFATLVNYNIFISEFFARKNEYESLAHLAYTDELTGLANRSKYEKYVSLISEEKNDYCIVSIDLNRLKKVNDELGHLMGDKYLAEFAQALENTFGQAGFVARIGGDEFVAVLTDENMRKVDDLADELANCLDELNKLDNTFIRSAAVGYAFRHECTEESENEIYLIADERMYKNKQLAHEARK